MTTHLSAPPALELVVLDMAGTTVLDDGVVETAFQRAAERTGCLLYTSPSPRDQRGSRMPSSA